MSAPARPPVEPLLDARGTDRLRAALTPFTVEGVHELLGLRGQVAHDRGDLVGVARAVRAAGDDRVATLVRLFLLGQPVEEAAAARALHPLATADAAELLERSGGDVRARLEIRPYAETDAQDAAWRVVSDFGADVRPGPLAHDHVLGIGSASLTLAQASPRVPAARALDVGTGCGIQALHLSRHCAQVTATDLSPRALRLAATTAALSGQRWDLRAGSLLEPVAGERFDLVVANPPFVVSPGTERYDYRDSGLPGDAVCRELVRGLPRVLAPGGCAQLLANWVLPADGTWDERVGSWLAGTGCDVWVWQREVADLGEYVSLWLRDAGETPGSARWVARYDSWLDWFAAQDVPAVGMGIITLWRPDDGTPATVQVLEDLPQQLDQPVGRVLPEWIARRRWLAAADDAALLGAALRVSPDVSRVLDQVPGPDGWHDAAARLRQASGLRWEVEVDEPIAALVAACDGTAPLQVQLAVLATVLGVPVDEVAPAALPVVRDLVGRGFLLPATPVAQDGR